MSAEKIRDRSVDELNNKLQDLKEELFHLRFQNAINQLDNPMRIKAVRKDIARIKTVLHEIELNIVRTSKVTVEKVEKPVKEVKKASKEQAEEEKSEAPKVRKPRKKKVEEPVTEAAVQEKDEASAESKKTEE